MNFIELLLLAVGLAMDAFAVSICAGLTMKKITLKNTLIIGLYFGIFQAAMPLIGYAVATRFAGKIITYDHWIAFALLSFLGFKMVAGSIKKEESDKNDNDFSVKPAKMLPLAIATSIDALAVGISFAFLQVNIISAVILIGFVTLVLSMIGVKIGNIFGVKFKSKAELSGGIILIIIGLKILFEHLNIFNM